MSYYSFRLLAVALLTVFFATAGGAQTAGPRPLITQAIDENKLVTLVGNTRPEAQPQNDAGPAADDFHLDMYLQLKRSAEQETAAREFVESLTDKTSPNFHKWITAAEYGQRFGAAAGDIATVSRWLESHGFTVNGVPANKMVIDFSGNAGQVRAALHTEIHKLDLEGKQYFANVSDPQIPAALVPAVTGVVSLSDFRPRSMYTPRAQYTANSEQHIVVPGDLAIIYNLAPAFAAGYTGAGQTIAVLEDTDLFNGTGDWNTFRQTFNLTQYANGSLTQVHPGPSAGITCQDPGVNYDDAEAALDVEWASAAAPDAAVVMASCESSSTNFGGFIALQNMLAGGGPLPSVVSISYGEPETDAGAALNSYINTLYQTAAAAGVSVFVSSGDAAAAGNDRVGFMPSTDSASAASPPRLTTWRWVERISATPLPALPANTGRPAIGRTSVRPRATFRRFRGTIRAEAQFWRTTMDTPPLMDRMGFARSDTSSKWWAGAAARADAPPAARAQSRLWAGLARDIRSHRGNRFSAIRATGCAICRTFRCSRRTGSGGSITYFAIRMRGTVARAVLTPGRAAAGHPFPRRSWPGSKP